MQEPESREPAGISRRDLLIGAGAMAAALASSTAHSGDHAGHRHEDHATRHPELLDAVNQCLDKGQRCIAHCLVSFKEGDTSLAACAAKVHEMEAICSGFAYLVASNSVYSKEYAQICKQVCSDCEKECRKHEDQHVECKQCAEACAQVVKMIDATYA
ncbi:MAG: Csp1 family four helix bundle copper storage protein [Chromatiales bacterium]|jgi:Cys-rich four helix bundle protein (predicted Tat secretion target)